MTIMFQVFFLQTHDPYIHKIDMNRRENYLCGNLRDVGANVPLCSIVVSLEVQFSYYVHFRTYTVKKPCLIPQLWVK